MYANPTDGPADNHLSNESTRLVLLRRLPPDAVMRLERYGRDGILNHAETVASLRSALRLVSFKSRRRRYLCSLRSHRIAGATGARSRS